MDDLVYLYTYRNKHGARDRYIVVSVEGEWCNVRMSYRVKLSQCYKVNADIRDAILYPSMYDYPASDTDQDIISSSSPLSALPPVPAELIMPLQLFTYPQTHQETEHTPEAPITLSNESVTPTALDLPVLYQANSSSSEEEVPIEPTSRPQRVRRKPERYKDYVA